LFSKAQGFKLMSSGPNTDDDHHDNGGLATAEARPQLKRPPMYKVVLLNDDYTPMDFVIEVLMIFFKMEICQREQTPLVV